MDITRYINLDKRSQEYPNPDYQPFDAGGEWKERDDSYFAAELKACELAGLTSGVIKEVECTDSWVDEEAGERSSPIEIPTDGLYLLILGDLGDPIMVLVKNGQRLAAWYFSFRGSYIGSLLVASTRVSYQTTDFDNPDGSWVRNDNDIMRDSLVACLDEPLY